jgi:hypothetical protein
MGKKRYTPEQIIGKLREAEVALTQEHTPQMASQQQIACTKGRFPESFPG